MNWKTWLYGLASAFVGGLSTGVTAMIVTPTEYNATLEGIKNVAILSVVSGAVSAFLYLKQSPLPPLEDNTLK